MSLPFRSRVEHKTYALMQRMNALPRFVALAVFIGLIAIGIFVPHVGFVATAVVALLVGFLVYYTWPRLTSPEKLMRIAVLFLAVALAVIQAFPRP